jgi:hypothetical protein
MALRPAGAIGMGQAEVRARNGKALASALRYYFLLGVALPFVIPDGYVRSFPAAMSLVQWFDWAIPGIPRLAKLSPFPDVMRTFLIVMWLLVPFAAYRVARVWTWNPGLFALKRSDQWFVVGSMTFIAALFFTFFYVFLDVSTPLESAGGRGGLLMVSLTQHRIGLALLGSTCFCSIAGTLGLAARLAYLVATRTTPEKANAS